MRNFPLLLLLGALTMAPAPAATAASADPGAAPVSAGRDAEPRGVDLTSDAVLPRTPSSRTGDGRFRIRYWPTRKIRYHETIPAQWQWSLDNAIDHWNGTGARIRLVKVSSRKRAELTIGYGNTGVADGLGTLGYAPGPYMNFVRLSPRYKRVNENDPEQRVWVARLLAHEIGHNLGYDHTAGTCSLMSPVFQFGRCGPLSTGSPGYYICRYIDAPLLKRHVRVYGGRAKRPAKDCLIEPLPPQLADVTFSGGGDEGPVRIAWRVVRPPPGASLRVSSWRGTSCGAVPRSAGSTRLGIDRTSWTDATTGDDTYCYAVQVLNRFGGAQRPVSKALRRWLPTPAPPRLGAFAYSGAGQEFTFSYARRTGISLEYAVVDLDEAGAACATRPDGYLAEQRSASLAAVEAPYLRACYTLVESNGFGDRSDPVFVTVEVPAPTATPTILSVVPGPGGYSYRIRATLPSGTVGAVGIQLLEGACPSQAPPDLWFYDGYEIATDTYQVDPSVEGQHCALVAATDRYGRHGPVLRHPFTVSFPPMVATPTVGPVTVEGRRARFQVSALPSTYRVGVTLLAGACPSQPPSDSFWYDGYEDGTVENRWWVDAWQGGAHCLLVAAIDDRGRHGPVVTRTFTAVD